MIRNAASHFRFRFLTAAGALALLAVPSMAYAQNNNPNCPPGSWFCAEAAPPPPSNGLQPLPPAQQPPVIISNAPPPPPPVVVYQPPPPTMYIAPPREAPPPYIYRAPEWSRKNEWGLNLHIGGAAIGKGTDGDAAMGLLGAGLRYRPIPQVALEGDLDFAGGRDYNGYRRTETELMVNVLVFLNPKDRAQFYFLGGAGMAGAHAVDDRSGYDAASYDYTYLGIQGGVGMEYRASRHFALNTDARLFVRGRVDGNAQTQPEFTNSSGQTTNTSGGALFTAGMTFYF